MSFQIRDGITFDDVLLIPQHSTLESRSKVDLSVSWGKRKYNHPIIPANMKTVISPLMAEAIVEGGGLAILHRFESLQEQINLAEDLIDRGGNMNSHVAVSVGVKNHDRASIPRFTEVGIKMFCIDIAHGDSQQCVEMVSWMKESYPELFVIAGNVATGQGATRLWQAGADVVKVGIGPGSLCTTRIETGNGVPQLTALMDVAEAQENLLALYKTKNSTRKFPFIADGGIKNAGDIVKALCFADMVMVGNLFAGCDEAPGTTINIGGRLYKEYVGSSTHKTNHIEGVAAMVPYKGPFDIILTKLLEGLRSGCSYQGAHDLNELKDNPAFMRITNAGLRESHPHDVVMG